MDEDRLFRVMIIAGEVSGDIHAARLVAAVRERMPGVSFFGIGGEQMRLTGVETVHDTKEMAVMGLTEVLRRIVFFRRVFHEMLALAAARKPDAVILVDYPGFNLRFATRAHAMGIKVIYYICPQVWAWHRSRIPKMATIIDRLITIFPFEPAVFDGTALRVDFAGHPLVDEAREVIDNSAGDLPWQGEPRVALLPGSRHQEIERLLPAMWAASAIVAAKRPGASFMIATPSEKIEEIVREIVQRLPGSPPRWSIVTGDTRRVLRRATAAFVASGTATIEAALMRCPMVIPYRVSHLTYLMLRALVKVDHIGMVNLVAGKRICPELVQYEATPDALAAAIDPFLDDNPARKTVLGQLEDVSQALGPGGAADRAAEIVIEELRAD